MRVGRFLASVAAGAAGAVFACASPPFDFYAALWLGMAGLALLVLREEKLLLREAGGLGVLFGMGANVVAFRFVPSVVSTFTTLSTGTGIAALLLLSLEQSVRWGAALMVALALRRRGVPSALAFASGVFAGTFVPAVFPWTPAGGVTPIPAMVQLAESFGERGVTFVMALSSGLLAEGASLLARRAGRLGWARLAMGATIPLVTFVLGRLRIAEVESARRAARTAKVALLDPGTDPHDRWKTDLSAVILARLTLATGRVERDGAELTIWPEASYPFAIAHETRRCPVGPFAMLPFGVRGPVLTGMVTTGANGDLRNSAAVCQTNGVLTEPQDKMHLLWFGETIPWLDQIPWVRDKFTRGLGLIAGDRVVLQRAGRVRASVLNCFEDTLPGAGREAMAAEPNLLVNVTNDAWFAGSAESELHLRLSVLRAVESRRDLVRAVNEGVTSWVDAAGVVRARMSGPGPHAMMTDAALIDGDPTWFDRWGDAPLCLLLAAGVVVATRRTSPK